MRAFFIRFLTIGALVSLSACASAPQPAENYLDAGARQHIKTVDAVLIAKQNRVGADIKRNETLTDIGALAAGLGITVLPTLLDVGVTGVRSINANKMAKPVREKLKGHDYAREFKQQVEQSLEGTTLDGIEQFTIVRDEYPGLRGLIISESQADAVLLMDMKYSFTPSFETLYVHSQAVLFPKRDELKPFQEVPDKDNELEFSDNIYRNQYAVGISTKLKGAKPAENAAFWAEMSEEQLLEVLEVAALTLSDTIANDISIDDLESDLNLIPEGYALNTKYDNFNRKFAQIRSIDDVLETPPDTELNPEDTGPEDNDDDAEPAAEPETEIDATILDRRTGS